MRHPALFALLAGAALACNNATAPRDAGTPTLSEASDRAHLDLREERASLTAAGNAVSAAIGDDGVGSTPEALIRPKAHGIAGMRHRVHVLGGVAARQQTAMNCGMQRFDATVHHFGKACDIGDIADV